MSEPTLSVEELIKRIQQENAKERARTSSLLARYFASFLGHSPETLNDINNEIIDDYRKQHDNIKSDIGNSAGHSEGTSEEGGKVP